jgi:hypothetical protein
VVDSAQELGTYGPDGPQTLSATLPGAPSDTCDFTCEIIAGVTGGLNIASGSISQEIATTTFSALAPDNRFALSVWVCPGSGSASLAFVMADAAGEPVTTIGVKIDANGNLTPTAGLVDYGVIEAVPFKHPDHPTEPDLTFYRVYITFDLTYTEPMPYASTHVVLQNNSLGVGDPQAVWFDGIQLEKLSDTDTPKPSSFHPYGHLISPTLEKTIGGDNSYYEW